MFGNTALQCERSHTKCLQCEQTDFQWQCANKRTVKQTEARKIPIKVCENCSRCMNVLSKCLCVMYKRAETATQQEQHTHKYTRTQFFLTGLWGLPWTSMLYFISTSFLFVSSFSEWMNVKNGEIVHLHAARAVKLLQCSTTLVYWVMYRACRGFVAWV